MGGEWIMTASADAEIRLWASPLAMREDEGWTGIITKPDENETRARSGSASSRTLSQPQSLFTRGSRSQQPELIGCLNAHTGKLLKRSSVYFHCDLQVL
eukprot:m.127254 g.127254  ORF g.127254 m.127254 type:complete len:99 (+) comp14541_c0_seq8:148-444(+)